jgi:hypothetical protein
MKSRIGCIRNVRNVVASRRAATLAGLGVLVILGLTALPSVGAAAIGRVATGAGAAADVVGDVTVPAPGAGPGATVTVSKTTHLVNQTVLVSWTGFRPSSDSQLANSGDSLDISTERPVRVYQCRGTDPGSSSDCYGSLGFRGVDASQDQPAIPEVVPFTYPGQTDKYNSTPDGPANWQDNVTRADGTGEVSIQLFTKRESAALGCDADTPCSLVVVPNYGRPAGATEDKLDAPWSWGRRTVIPLAFLPVGDACPLTGSSLRVEGSPVAAGVLASWRARTCVLDTAAVTLDYTAIGEPQTREDVASGVSDTGLLIDPLPEEEADATGVVYAPVSATGLVVAYQIDDIHGRPITDLKLNPRLVAKLITASYRIGGDPAVSGNPFNIFADPELKALNPGIDFPDGAPGNHPLILGDISDTTSALTRWIAADSDAAAFVSGTPDPWGMRVNDNYKGLQLPFQSFPLLDEKMSDTFAPMQELEQLARQLSIAQFPGGSTVVENGQNVVLKYPRQNPGRREIIGIIDATAAARFRLSSAALQNASGAFMKPTEESMLTGVEHSTVNGDGVTRSVDLTDKNPGIYPLSLLVSAALSTKAPADERADMADLLTYVAGAGQTRGDEVGQLPDGNAPLSDDLRAKVLEARKAVLAGKKEVTVLPSASASPSATPTPDPSDAPSDGGGGAPPDVVGPAPVDPGPSAGPVLNEPHGTLPVPEQPTLLTVAAQLAGKRLVILPLLGILFLVSLVGGPALMWMSQTGRGPQWLRR